jgi:hypothetical protein
VRRTFFHSEILTYYANIAIVLSSTQAEASAWAQHRRTVFGAVNFEQKNRGIFSRPAVFVATSQCLPRVCGDERDI